MTRDNAFHTRVGSRQVRRATRCVRLSPRLAVAWAALALAGAQGLHAQPGQFVVNADGRADTSARANQIRAAEMSIRDALLSSDTVALSRLHATEFVEISVLGTLRTWAENMRDVATGDLQLLTIKYDSLDVRVYGDVGILTSIVNRTGTYLAKPFATRIWYTRVFVWRDGRWQTVMVQQTPIR